jgi:hypothetical protein
VVAGPRSERGKELISVLKVDIIIFLMLKSIPRLPSSFLNTARWMQFSIIKELSFGQALTMSLFAVLIV